MTVKLEGDSSKEQVWIFGFGSLIWKTGMLTVPLLTVVICYQWSVPYFTMCSYAEAAAVAGFDYSKRVEGYIKDYRCCGQLKILGEMY